MFSQVYRQHPATMVGAMVGNYAGQQAWRYYAEPKASPLSDQRATSDRYGARALSTQSPASTPHHGTRAASRANHARPLTAHEKQTMAEGDAVEGYKQPEAGMSSTSYMDERSHALSDANERGMLSLEGSTADRAIYALMRPVSGREVASDLRSTAEKFVNSMKQDIRMIHHGDTLDKFHGTADLVLTAASFFPTGRAAVTAVRAAPAVLRATTARLGVFGRGGAESTRLISSINRVSSNVANKPFLNEKALAEGWQAPYPADLSLREITIAKETKFYRVHTDFDKPVGRFLAREKEISPYLNNPEALRLHLGLPDVPIYITEVNIPPGARLLAGRIGSQPAFGLMEESGFQYQLISKIPESSFANTRPILKQNLYHGTGY